VKNNFRIYKNPIAISIAAYFTVALCIYLETQSLTNIGFINPPISTEKIFWLLASTGLFSCFISELILLVKNKGNFRSISATDIKRSDLFKKTTNLLMTVFFSFAIYIFFIKQRPHLEDPLAFTAITTIIYFASAAICQSIRHIPIFIIFFRRQHERL
jgi:hypothetical protein